MNATSEISPAKNLVREILPSQRDCPGDRIHGGGGNPTPVVGLMHHMDTKNARFLILQAS